MQQFNIFLKVLIGITVLAFITSAIAKKPPVIWQASFYATMPNRAGVSMAYCRSHSPNQFRTTIKNMLTNGAKARNGILVKYRDYKQTERNGLYFIKVDASFSGTFGDKLWKLNSQLYEQKLTSNGVTDVIWSNHDCKGKFTGRVINLPGRRTKG